MAGEGKVAKKKKQPKLFLTLHSCTSACPFFPSLSMSRNMSTSPLTSLAAFALDMSLRKGRTCLMRLDISLALPSSLYLSPSCRMFCSCDLRSSSVWSGEGAWPESGNQTMMHPLVNSFFSFSPLASSPSTHLLFLSLSKKKKTNKENEVNFKIKKKTQIFPASAAIVTAKLS